MLHGYKYVKKINISVLGSHNQNSPDIIKSVETLINTKWKPGVHKLRMRSFGT